MIILRSDGTPIYNFAVVVDDHDMDITHVIRGGGVDHLTNAARQVQIYKAMGWDLPIFAHVPLIYGTDGAKLSKRHGARGIEAYRAMGFLPAALRNYLVRLGWSHGDDEIFSTEQAVAWFDIDDINKSPGRLDFAKLADVNSHYIRQANEAELIRRIKDLLAELPDGAETTARIETAGWDRLAKALPSLKERAKTLNDLLSGASYLLAMRPLQIDDKAGKLLDAEGGPTSPSCAASSRRQLIGTRPCWRPWCEPMPSGQAKNSGKWPSRCAPPSPAARSRRPCSM